MLLELTGKQDGASAAIPAGFHALFLLPIAVQHGKAAKSGTFPAFAGKMPAPMQQHRWLQTLSSARWVPDSRRVPPLSPVLIPEGQAIKGSAGSQLVGL